MVEYQLYAMPPGVITHFYPILIPINKPAVQPELNVVNMNLIGTMYTEYMETGRPLFPQANQYRRVGPLYSFMD